MIRPYNHHKVLPNADLSVMALHMKNTLKELLLARSVHVGFPRESLFQTDRVRVVIAHLTESLREQWGIVLPTESSNLTMFISQVPKPVFIILDDIGAAFESQSHGLEMQGDEFVDFLGEVCDTLAATDGVYYLLSGRADFMQNAGMTAKYIGRGNRSPSVFERITLNPIREHHISSDMRNASFFSGTNSN